MFVTMRVASVTVSSIVLVVRVLTHKDVGIVNNLVQKVCVDLNRLVDLVQLLLVAHRCQ